MSRRILKVSAGLVAISLACSSALAWDVESKPLGSDLTTYTFGDSTDGFVLTKGGDTFDIVDLSSGSGTVAFGQRSIVPNSPIPGGPINFAFVHAVGTFSLTVGDFGDDTDTVELTALDSGGNVIDSDAVTLVPIGDTFSFATLFVSAPGIASATVSGASVAYDNFFTTDNVAPAIPLPPAAYAGLVGLVTAGFCGLRMRRAVCKV